MHAVWRDSTASLACRLGHQAEDEPEAPQTSIGDVDYGSRQKE